LATFSRESFEIAAGTIHPAAGSAAGDRWLSGVRDAEKPGSAENRRWEELATFAVITDGLTPG
jgi:hypothetical protein